MGDTQKVFMARHGERRDLVDKSWRDTAERPGDPPLTETGLAQAHQLGLRLQGEGITQIYASPFLRTIQTAHQVAKVLQIPVRVEYGFSEGFLPRLFPHGEPRMLALSALKSQMPLISLDECSHWGRVDFPEKYPAVNRRVRQSTRAVLDRHPAESMLLVGHGLSVEYMMKAILPEGKMPHANDIPYCSVTQCERRLSGGAWTVVGRPWDDAFLKTRQDAQDAVAQAKLWGLDE